MQLAWCSASPSTDKFLGVAHGGAQTHNSSDAVAHEGPQVAAAPGVQRRGRAAAPGRFVAAAGGVQPLGWPPASRSVKTLVSNHSGTLSGRPWNCLWVLR